MKISVYPRDPNPYQGLLYRKIINNVVIKYLEPPLNSNIGYYPISLSISI